MDEKEVDGTKSGAGGDKMNVSIMKKIWNRFPKAIHIRKVDFGDFILYDFVNPTHRGKRRWIYDPEKQTFRRGEMDSD